MRASHRKDERISVNGDNVPRAGQSLSFRRLVSLFIESFLASADDSEHLLRCQVDFSDRVVLAVAQVQEVLVLSEDMAHALRVMELRLVVGTVDESNFSVANLVLKLHRILVYEHDAIVGRIGDYDEISVETSLFFNADDLAWVSEILPACDPLFATLADGLVHALGFYFVCLLLFGLPSNRCRVIELFIVKVVRHGKEQIQNLSMSFARQNEDGHVGGGEHDKAWPGAPLEAPPDEHLIVINDRVFDFILEDGVADLLGPFFIDKLGRVAAHEHNGVLSCELLLQKLQVRQHVQAVDAAVGPEVDQRELAAQVSLHRHGLRVEPDVVLGELLRPHLIQLLLW